MERMDMKGRRREEGNENVRHGEEKKGGLHSTQAK